MFDSKSRYARVKTQILRQDTPSGPHELTYVVRRFIPAVRGDVTLVEHIVRADDRLDNITARYLGDPTLFWQICDASKVLSPAELTAEPGDTIRIALRIP
jgi:hypothetical protein